MLASDLGSKIYDEISVIETGRNYGCPRRGVQREPRAHESYATWTPTSIASPSGITIVCGHICVACLRGQTLYRLDLDGRNARGMLSGYGRLRTVTVAPDGSLWVTTSTRDQVVRADGVPQTPEGDRILRIASCRLMYKSYRS